jgi:uncharacterized sulfatase
MQNITRRLFLKQLAAATAAFSAPAAIAAQTHRPPNILWISCEDISPHLGCYAEQYAITPNLDQFSAEGVRYTRAYTVHGVCAPSRSGIITGMYPSEIGTVNMRCRATIPEPIKCFPEYLRQAGYYCTNNSKEDYNFNPSKTVWDESSKDAHWNKRPDGKPFFAVFNFTGTHESTLWNSADFDNTHPGQLKIAEWQNPENMTVPPIYPDVPAVRRDLARLFENITKLDYFFKDRIDELKKAGLYEDTIIFFWSDHGDGLPRTKRWTYESGTLVPLIVRIPEKYRTARQAKPGTADGQFVNFIDLGPTVLNLAGIPTPQYMRGRAFLGDNLSRQRPCIFGARQRIDELYDMVRSVRDERYRYVVNFMPYLPYLPYLAYEEKCNTMQALRQLHAEGKLNAVQDQWMADHRPPEELYDVENDPWETRNLADEPACQDVKKRLRQALSDWMIETRDTGLLAEPEMVRLAQNVGSEYSIFRQPGGAERVKRLMQVALISANPQPGDHPVIEAALTDVDPAVRYWAVLALRAVPDNTDRLLTAAKDENASVRIAAALSLALSGKQKDAVSILETELKQVKQQEETLQFALHVLNQCGPAASSAMETVKTLQQARGDTIYIGRACDTFINQYDSPE